MTTREQFFFCVVLPVLFASLGLFLGIEHENYVGEQACEKAAAPVDLARESTTNNEPLAKLERAATSTFELETGGFVDVTPAQLEATSSSDRFRETESSFTLTNHSSKALFVRTDPSVFGYVLSASEAAPEREWGRVFGSLTIKPRAARIAPGGSQKFEIAVRNFYDTERNDYRIGLEISNSIKGAVVKTIQVPFTVNKDALRGYSEMYTGGVFETNISE